MADMLQDLYDGDGEVDGVLPGVVGSKTAMTGFGLARKKTVWLHENDCLGRHFHFGFTGKV